MAKFTTNRPRAPARAAVWETAPSIPLAARAAVFALFLVSAVLFPVFGQLANSITPFQPKNALQRAEHGAPVLGTRDPDGSEERFWAPRCTTTRGYKNVANNKSKSTEKR